MKLIFFLICLFTSFVVFAEKDDLKLRSKLSDLKKQTVDIHNDIISNNKVIDDNWINAYASAFPDRKSCIGAINFPLDALLGRIVPYIIEHSPTFSSKVSL